MNNGDVIRFLEDKEASIEKFLYNNPLNTSPGEVIFRRGLKEYYHAMELVTEFLTKDSVITEENNK